MAGAEERPGASVGFARRAARGVRAFGAAYRTDLLFWGSFLALNVLLFLPRFLFDQGQSTLWPNFDWSSGAYVRELKRVFFRTHYDVFRISLELSVLVGLRLMLGRDGRGLRRATGGVYVYLLFYAVYESAIYVLYATEPVFYNDLPLALEGARIAVDTFDAPKLALYVLPVLALAAAVWIGLRLLRVLFRSADWRRLHRASRLLAVGIALFVGVAAGHFRERLRMPAATVSTGVVKTANNLRQSIQMRRATAAYRHETVVAAYGYEALRLARRPDVVLVFVESYGGLLYTHPSLAAPYRALLAELEARLAGAGWSSATALSEAPVTGGASWLAYTSFLFGLRVDNQGFYRSLMNAYQDRVYPDFGQFLRQRGYTYYRLSALPERARSPIPWDTYRRFHNIDRWIRHEDLAFTGTGYGWGPAPPDQYTLNYALSWIRAREEAPFLLFYITQNSHYPWTFMPPLVDDWRRLNTPTADRFAAEDALHEASPDLYLGAVTYQLRMLTDLVQNAGDDRTLFVLVGDHQPPLLTLPGDDYRTPVHLISRDRALVEGFRAYGFAPGLAADTAVALRHEGMYAMLVRELARPEADTTAVLPPYRPFGVSFDPNETC